MQRMHHICAAIMLLGGGLLVGSPAQAYHSTPNADAERGRQVYMQTCVACHGPDGTGSVPGTPDLTKPGGRLSKSNDVLLEHVRDGFRSEGSSMAMPPKGGNPSLREDELKDVIAYMHKFIAD